ncbi:damage-inducible mutagenesis protein (plasmid) [Rhizobium ruizarguesonis]|uniref:Damage-inducible mutagenesis protein n=1 Tax=Rhizobium ruizarguesonis TaxID=2081791 RepID=A0AAE8Q639_9HYPH|nr:ImuA family protein [Rhizobium ruizarguesonis]NEH89145.1 damage-inducible mutagenesis protein [Rhizobium ruizarguesonis]NEJ08706.1 damage-inducible mutagenesis protein [Rhizobium ruizarguesonis]NEJ18235.1 damage-inducible mutagenesis protein [Rhizobium ruizarguesonis]NEJ59366.1 damage-inducible mutagenesis protein [Rhizobium ruizarguesonis]NEJ66706.1 damage-inducible mutagenesis protein [Rhizobium ruizarguesonis]
MSAVREHVISDLRARISSLESPAVKKLGCLEFGVPEIDGVLPGGGLAYGALHEFAGGGAGTVDGAAAALFAAGIAARTKGPIVWCLTRPDLFFPALAQVGLHPDRVIFVESDKEEDVLVNMEEGLAHGGLGAVVGELVRLPMTASRRLQLAAERTGTLALVVRRWRRQTEANDFGQPTASTTRWRVSVLPSEELAVPGVGRARWLLELMRVKAGECAEFCVGACDDKGRIDLSTGSADGSHSASRSIHSG